MFCYPHQSLVTHTYTKQTSRGQWCRQVLSLHSQTQVLYCILLNIRPKIMQLPLLMHCPKFRQTVSSQISVTVRYRHITSSRVAVLSLVHCSDLFHGFVMKLVPKIFTINCSEGLHYYSTYFWRITLRRSTSKGVRLCIVHFHSWCVLCTLSLGVVVQFTAVPV